MKILLSIILTIITFNAVILYSGDIHWADKVISKSVKSNINHGRQILGEPNVMPDFGSSNCAWSPELNRAKTEWIMLGFDSTITVKTIFIYENLNPGAIIAVTVYDQSNNEHQVYSNNNPVPLRVEGRVLKILVDQDNIKANSVKIEVSMMNYYGREYQIDAIGISSKAIDYEVKIDQIEDLLDVVSENLGPNINTVYNEVAPIITASGKKLFFTRQDDPNNIGEAKLQDIYFSTINKDGKFSPAKNVGPPLNDKFNNFVISILPDENQIIVGNLYIPGLVSQQGFSISRFDGQNWTVPQPLKIEEYKNYVFDGSYCLAPSGKTMILSISYKGCLGKHDLYVSFKDKNDVWSAPVSLGPSINNFGDEISPFFAADNMSLYFSSDGYPGYGSSDMFVTRRLDDTWTKWSKPKNLGPRLNTKGWDAYYTIPASGNYAYFVSSIRSIGGTDIFRVVLPEDAKPKPVVLLSGMVLDKTTNLPISAKINYETLPEGVNAGSSISNQQTGAYKIALPTGKKFGYLAEAEGYLSINEFLDLTDLKTYKEMTNDLYLVPITKNVKIRLNNIFFGFGKYNLLEESFPELDRVVKLLKDMPKLKIEIQGHTDSIGTEQNNLRLSKNRAQSVVNYFIKKGIASKRLKSMGYGESKPIDTNETDEGRQKNRRVEFVILEN
ncbi:MAG: OmpA family protein [bacterium]